ncbi:hypothetical protein MSG28_010060 [Choristoneura fumiferana]|uniref:Uncharacterized protein n=1 Tax=Choristoneura fumiferana TaxID=7141 RepID=A0ACC0KJC7_CHOFU|nr:hypothetical protein MSG28_010060 [Choristoneura fumiferana]
MSSNSSLSEDMNITVLVDNEDQSEFITHRSPETPQHVWTPMEPLSSSTPIPMDIRPQFFMTHIPMGAAHPTPWTSYSYNPPGRVNPILRNIAAYKHPGFAIPEYQNFGVYYERVVLTTISQPRSSASCKPLGLATAKPQYNSYNPWGAAIPQPQSMTKYKPQSSTTPELQIPSDSVTPKPSGPEIPQELTFAQRVDQYHKDFASTVRMATPARDRAPPLLDSARARGASALTYFYHFFVIGLIKAAFPPDVCERQLPRQHVPDQRTPARAARHAVTNSFTDLGLHDKKNSTGNDSFTDHEFHDKHIKVEGFIWGVATKYADYMPTEKCCYRNTVYKSAVEELK